MVNLLNFSISVGIQRSLTVVLSCIFLKANSEHLFKSLYSFREVLGAVESMESPHIPIPNTQTLPYCQHPRVAHFLQSMNLH